MESHPLGRHAAAQDPADWAYGGNAARGGGPAAAAQASSATAAQGYLAPERGRR